MPCRCDLLGTEAHGRHTAQRPQRRASRTRAPKAGPEPPGVAAGFAWVGLQEYTRVTMQKVIEGLFFESLVRGSHQELPRSLASGCFLPALSMHRTSETLCHSK